MTTIDAPFQSLPTTAAWRHHTARDGFEVVFFATTARGLRVRGDTAALEGGTTWSVAYDITVDARWHARSAVVKGVSAGGERHATLESDGDGHWRVNGSSAPHLDGCFDVDLESSSCTNTFPVHRLRLAVGTASEAPAVYVRAADLEVERLDQRYRRIPDDARVARYEYESPAFDARCTLVFDASGLVIDYPGLASRVA